MCWCDVQARLYWTYFRTAHAVFNTSFTTVMAFIATGISPIMPISTFGYYAATCIIMNYIFVLVYTPPIVIIWNRYLDDKPCCPPPCCAATEVPPSDNIERNAEVELQPMGHHDDEGFPAAPPREEAAEDGAAGSQPGVGVGDGNGHIGVGVGDGNGHTPQDANRNGNMDGNDNGLFDPEAGEGGASSGDEGKLSPDEMPCLQRCAST